MISSPLNIEEKYSHLYFRKKKKVGWSNFFSMIKFRVKNNNGLEIFLEQIFFPQFNFYFANHFKTNFIIFIIFLNIIIVSLEVCDLL